MLEDPKVTFSDSSLRSLRKKVFVRFAMVFCLLGLMFFLPSWTLRYWEAWAYFSILLVPMTFLVRYLYKNDPRLLERRMRMKEKQKAQRLIIALSWLFFLPAFVIPGFDRRFEWSNMPLTVTVISELLVLFGYLMIALVFKANSYASRVIEVKEGQKVISTGLYSIVRHPMYLGVLVFYLFSPLALGSYWAVIPAFLIVPLLIARIKNEERELLYNLEGYREYVTKTKYRLLPGIW